MEVKVTIEDFDLEALVDRAVIDEISRLTTVKMHEILTDNKLNYQTLNEKMNHAVEREASRAIDRAGIKNMIENRINDMIDKEIESIVRLKVAKVMTPYLNLIKDAENGKRSVDSGDRKSANVSNKKPSKDN